MDDWKTAIHLQAIPSVRKRCHDDLLLRISNSSTFISPPASPYTPQTKNLLAAWSTNRVIRPLPLKKRRTSTSESQTATLPPTTTGPINLSPCHVCGSRPKMKSQLENFNDCSLCSKRACNICRRACTGLAVLPTPAGEGKFSEFDGEETKRAMCILAVETGCEEFDWDLENEDRKNICSRCCVETGIDGDIVCFGCLGRS